MKHYYSVNGITLYHGDCRDVMKDLPRESADLVVTDPPFAVSVAGSGHIGQPGNGTRKLNFFRGDTDWPKQIQMICNALTLTFDVTIPCASFYVWCSHRVLGHLVNLFEDRGLSSRVLAWVKPYPPPPAPRSGWPSAVEMCVYAYPKGRIWTPAPKDTPRSNVFVVDNFRHGQPGKVDHPAQKPLAVIEPLIMASSQRGQCVLDPFAGSGTTLLAAWRLGRKAIGIEIEERYCEIAAERLRRTALPNDRLVFEESKDSEETYANIGG